MSDAHYAVLFRGELAPGFTQEQVKSSFGQLFGLSDAKLDRIFSQSEVILKRDVSEEEANRIAKGLYKIGMQVEVCQSKQANTVPAPIPEKKETPAPDESKIVSSEPTLSGSKTSDRNKYDNKSTGHSVHSIEETKEYPFIFSGKGSEYFKIWIVNIFLSIITLGIYSAWAKVRTQRYFYGNTAIDNSSFEYLADPIKILKGRLIAVVFAAIYFASDYISFALSLICAVILVIATPWIISRALRFRNHNSAWRGIRFSFDGNAIGAGMAYVIWQALSMLTLGLLFPLALQKQTQYSIGKSRFGGQDFHNSATIGNFYMIFLRILGIAIVGIILIGLLVVAAIPNYTTLKFTGAPVFLPILITWTLYFFIFVYFRVRFTNLRYSSTTIGNNALSSNYEIKSYAFLVFTNWLFILCTLGLFYPFAKVRSAQYAANHISLIAEGSLDEFVGEAHDDVSAVGGEVGDFFDFDIGF